MKLFGMTLGKDREVTALRETVTSLQRELEDIGWVNLARGPQDSSKYLPADFQQLLQKCRQYWIRAPLAGQWVNLTTAFVFGQGLSAPKAKDARVQEVLNEFWEDPDNQLSLCSAQAQWCLSAKRHYEGNLFFVLLREPSTGQVKVRIADTASIEDVICSPDDLARCLFYRRRVQDRDYDFRSDTYRQAPIRRVYYPHISLAHPELYDIPSAKFIKDAAIYHARFNCDLNDKFGIPELLRGLDWIKAHKDMAGDMATLIKTLAIWAWTKKVKGTPAQVAAAAARHQVKSDLTNPAPNVGAIHVSNEAISLDPVNTPTGGAQIHEKGLRAMVLQVSAASGIFEHYYGDASTGNLATATSMELPMVKRFEMHQQDWTHIYDTILQYRIDSAVLAGELPGRVEFLANENRYRIVTDFDRSIDIDFPHIVEEDLLSLANALTAALGQNLIDQEEAARQFMMARGINNIEEHMALVKAEQQERLQREQEQALKMPVGNGFGSNGAGRTPEPEKRVDRFSSYKLGETVTTTDRDPAVRLADKKATVLGKLDAYRRELAAAWRLFGRRLQEHLELVGPEGAQRAKITGLAGLLNSLQEDLLHAAVVYFPQAIDIGRKYVLAHLTKAQLEEADGKGAKLVEAASEELLQRMLRWNRTFVDTSLIPAVTQAMEALTEPEYSRGALVQDVLRDTLAGFESRIGAYASAFWAVEEQAVQDVGEAFALKVNFVGADDDGTCASCKAGMAGNPWPIAEAPRPGMDTVCLTNCRHALQIIENEAISRPGVTR